MVFVTSDDDSTMRRTMAALFVEAYDCRVKVAGQVSAISSTRATLKATGFMILESHLYDV